MSIVGGQVAGSAPMDAMLDLLSNAKAVKDRISQLNEAQRQAQEVLDQVGPAQDILQLRSDTEALKAEAAAAITEAKASAQALVDDGRAQAAKIVTDAKASAENIISQAKQVSSASDAKSREVSEAAATVNKLVASLEKRESALRSRSDACDAADAAMVKREEDLTRRVRALGDVLTQLSATIKTLG